VLSRRLLELVTDVLHGKLKVGSGGNSDFLPEAQLAENQGEAHELNGSLNFHEFFSSVYNGFMPISARNKLRGTIEEVELGDVMAHVVVRVGENLIESAITRRSADELKLKKGDTVLAVVKATEVMIQKD
jgi:molybdopterin-binding protein